LEVAILAICEAAYKVTKWPHISDPMVAVST
jgi:hypothetical protein